jgi:hypothetical protein
MKIRIARWMTCLTIGALGWSAHGLDSARDTLQDVESLFVLVENLPGELEQEGILQGQIKADVELGLLAADTPVLPMPSTPDLSTFKNYLYIVISAVDTPAGVAYSVRIDFNQLSVLEHRIEAGQIKGEYKKHRPGSSRMFASTWGTQAMGFVAKGEDIGKAVRKEVRQLVDRFTGDFRLAREAKKDPLYQAMGHRLPARVEVGTP